MEVAAGTVIVTLEFQPKVKSPGGAVQVISDYSF